MFKPTGQRQSSEIRSKMMGLALKYLPPDDSYNIYQAIQSMGHKTIDKSGKNLVDRPSSSPLLKHEIDFFIKILSYINRNNGPSTPNDTCHHHNYTAKYDMMRQPLPRKIIVRLRHPSLQACPISHLSLEPLLPSILARQSCDQHTTLTPAQPI